MPSGTNCPPIRHQFFDANGNPLASGLLYCFKAGTSTDEPVYQDSLLTAEHPQPVELDSDGYATLFLSPTSYRFVLHDANDVPVPGWDVDGVSALQGVGGAAGVDESGVAGEDLAANEPVYLSDGVGATGGRWYRMDADALLSSILPVRTGFATAAIALGATGFIRVDGTLDGFVGLTPGATYFAASAVGTITAVAPANARPLGIAINSTTLAILQTWQVETGIGICQGRLTLTTAVPVTTADVLAAATLYFTPVRGNQIGLYNAASAWRLYSFAELSIALPAAANQVYDVFVYDNAGVVTLELLAWTNDTTRATALALQNGVYVKSGVPTRRYVGTCRTTAVAGQTEDSVTKRFVWNYYHRVTRALERLETAGWTYSTATYRQANASTANQVAVVIGVAEDPVELSVLASVGNGAAGVAVAVAIGLDSTTTPAAHQYTAYVNSPSINNVFSVMSRYQAVLAVGYHFLAWLEISAATPTTTWYANNGAGFANQSGLVGSVRA